MVQTMALRFHWSDASRQAVLDYTRILAGPHFKGLNISKYYACKFYNAPENKKVFTFFCPKCCIALAEPMAKSKIGENIQATCTQCSAKYTLSTGESNYFINVDIEYQLRPILTDENVLEEILSKNEQRMQNLEKTGPSCSITDIHDGILYRENKFINSKKEDELVLTANVNCDGAPIFECSKWALWPLLLIINELPQKLRFRMLTMAAALFVDHEPNVRLMKLYLNSFLLQMVPFMKKGINVVIRGRPMRIFIIPLLICVDTVARPIISSRIQFNGYDGCHWYYAHGERDNSMRYLFETDKVIRHRNHEDYLQEVNQMMERDASSKNKKKQQAFLGIKGSSALSNFPFFDSIWGFPPEYMHGVVLGVTKQLWDEWTNCHSAFYLNQAARQLIDERLVGIRPIKEVYRFPKILKNKSKWKAAEWLFWLLFYSIPCLNGILQDEALSSFSRLVRSINILISPPISQEVLLKCEVDLLIFVRDCQKFYGSHFMTMNVHSLLHLGESVRQSGPLCATSAFPFESKIGQLKAFVGGPKGVPEQISNKSLQYCKLKNSLCVLPQTNN